jgi:hypothetical protein
MLDGQFFEHKCAMMVGEFRPWVSVFTISTFAVIDSRFG